MQNPFKGSLSIDFYTNQSTIKYIVLVVAAIIGVGSIIYTTQLVNILKERERENIELWAKAVEFSTVADIASLNFITDNIIRPDNSLPVIILDSATNEILTTRNIEVEESYNQKQADDYLNEMLDQMKEENDPQPILIRDRPGSKIVSIQYVYFRNSRLLRQLSAYPYIQLSVIAIFAFIAYLAFSYSRKAEQNRVWVGLAKETAHQLGTPLSSLMAWVEYLRELPQMENRQEIITELNKDVQRLEMITARFSNIGSKPILKDEEVSEVIEGVIAYLKPRVSSKVLFVVDADSPHLVAKMNRPLFEWVIENIVKNGIDAMSGIGKITVTVGQESEGMVFIDIADDGKGIAKGKIKEVFKPGFTTKKRGWGLGLTLVKRIIENYHMGKIYVKSSHTDVGTVFRISLKN
ncbi:histidine kinase [Roseivirga seohaensis subsp. aquiponti]|uniref:histidine kinase n=1 Tax=Roseivirga seohaensis subsp. aquiponti TaxID=1566026 RepID=A0A0L8AK90_9BACT|nr:HAMP domain-containing sensor histidine kinase [Roseivirga seohaensis]KOF02565.1 histidine kinase [Roseivirga seohaensis subsp. aquiponti]